MHAGKRLLTYRPLPEVERFHHSLAKYRWFFGGNRSGKSEANIGFLFRAPDNVKQQFPQFKAVDAYADLMQLIKGAMG